MGQLMEAHKNESSKQESSKSERDDDHGDDAKKQAKAANLSRAKKVKNNVRKIRMERMISKAELARRAALSTLTVDRVERGMSCRMDTKRKILEALGLKPTDRVMVFGDSEED